MTSGAVQLVRLPPAVSRVLRVSRPHQYRQVLRKLRLLPAEAVSYYRASARQKIASHREESDPQRLTLILERSRAEVAWVLAKYVK